MRVLSAIVSAAAYLGRPTARLAPIDPAEPVIIQPWRPAAMTDEPDPIAVFISDALKTAPGAHTPALLVLSAYEAWAERRGFRPADRDAVVERLGQYGTLVQTADAGRCLVGVELHSFALNLIAPGLGKTARTNGTPLRAIPGLRARVLADSALLAAELLAVLQSTRAVLEVATDEDGIAGDAVRLAAGMLDDAIADAAAPAPAL